MPMLMGFLDISVQQMREPRCSFRGFGALGSEIGDDWVKRRKLAIWVGGLGREREREREREARNLCGLGKYIGNYRDRQVDGGT